MLITKTYSIIDIDVDNEDLFKDPEYIYSGEVTKLN